MKVIPLLYHQKKTTSEEWKKRSKFKNEDTWSEKFEKYRNEGSSKLGAEKKANHKMEEANFIAFLDLYGKTILDMLDLKGGEIHEKVMNSIEKFVLKMDMKTYRLFV